MGNVGRRSYPECGVGGGEWAVKNWLYVGFLVSVSMISPIFLPFLSPRIVAPQTSVRRGKGKARWSKPRPRPRDNSRVPLKGGSAFGH